MASIYFLLLLFQNILCFQIPQTRKHTLRWQQSAFSGARPILFHELQFNIFPACF